MGDDKTIEFRLNTVGDGPVFELLVNNVRLDITRVGQLFSIRISGLITQKQLSKLGKMFELNDTGAELFPSRRKAVKPEGSFECEHPLCDVLTPHRHVSEEEFPFDGPYVRGPIIE